jgi:hypothetical protein
MEIAVYEIIEDEGAPIGEKFQGFSEYGQNTKLWKGIIGNCGKH